tara:strand:- start:89 stop:256 length:168 start_codon:yes stop_codon:yes gene_type:complete
MIATVNAIMGLWLDVATVFIVGMELVTFIRMISAYLIQALTLWRDETIFTFMLKA